MLKIITVSFNYGMSTMYQTMSEVLTYSIEKNCPEAIWINNCLEEPDTQGRVRGFISNTIKLEKWLEEFNLCEENDEIIFMDCDMLVLDNLKEVFDYGFDIAYTFREDSNLPLNGGIIFVKKNKRSQKFLERFLEINNTMLANPEFHQFWRNKYAGINQAAFGYMLEQEPNYANIFPLPCSKWNVCQDYTNAIKNGAKVLHIKGQLRKQIFEPNRQRSEELDVAKDLWFKYYEEMKNAI